MKSHRILWAMLLVIGLMACEEDYYPGGFYGYQIDYMLTGGGSKQHWYVTRNVVNGTTQSIQSCADTVIWVFELIDSDSIAGYQLTYDEQCIMYDTTIMGSIEASGQDTVFLDTIYVRRNANSLRYLFLDDITSESMSLHYTLNGVNYKTELSAEPSDYLGRQVETLLLNDESERWWKLTKLVYDGTTQSITDCADTTEFLFTKSGDTFTMALYGRDSECGISDEQSFFGEVEEIGLYRELFFDGSVILTGGQVENLTFTSLSPTSFTISYDSVVATYIPEN